MPNDSAPASLRFPKERRLIRPAEFLRVKNEGATVQGSLLILGVLKAPESPRFRVGLVTSKRVGGAVVRNRVRRRLREIVRRHQHALRGEIWFVIVARPRAARASYAQLEDEWLRLAKRAFILAP